MKHFGHGENAVFIRAVSIAYQPKNIQIKGQWSTVRHAIGDFTCYQLLLQNPDISLRGKTSFFGLWNISMIEVSETKCCKLCWFFFNVWWKSETNVKNKQTVPGLFNLEHAPYMYQVWQMFVRIKYFFISGQHLWRWKSSFFGHKLYFLTHTNKVYVDTATCLKSSGCEKTATATLHNTWFLLLCSVY